MKEGGHYELRTFLSNKTSIKCKQNLKFVRALRSSSLLNFSPLMTTTSIYWKLGSVLAARKSSVLIMGAWHLWLWRQLLARFANSVHHRCSWLSFDNSLQPTKELASISYAVKRLRWVKGYVLWIEKACKLKAVDGVTSVLSARVQKRLLAPGWVINENTTTVLKQESKLEELMHISH